MRYLFDTFRSGVTLVCFVISSVAVAGVVHNTGSCTAECRVGTGLYEIRSGLNRMIGYFNNIDVFLLGGVHDLDYTLERVCLHQKDCSLRKRGCVEAIKNGSIKVGTRIKSLWISDGVAKASTVLSSIVGFSDLFMRHLAHASDGSVSDASIMEIIRVLDDGIRTMEDMEHRALSLQTVLHNADGIDSVMHVALEKDDVDLGECEFADVTSNVMHHMSDVLWRGHFMLLRSLFVTLERKMFSVKLELRKLMQEFDDENINTVVDDLLYVHHEDGELRGAEYMYKESMSLLKKGDLNGAKTLFRGIVESFPEHRLSNASVYWLGEICHTQGDHVCELENFSQYLADGTGEKISMVALRMSSAFEKLGNHLDACDVLSRYAGMNDVLIRARLDELGCISYDEVLEKSKSVTIE